MSWKRLPTFFANIPLKLMPLTEGQQKAYETSGSLKQVAFQTIPSVSKIELRKYLESVYGLSTRQRPLRSSISSMVLPQPAATTSAQGTMPPAGCAPLSGMSDVLPLLTPVVKSVPDTLPPIQHQPTLPPPQASPKIKPPPGTGSQSLRQSSLPLWQMFGSASSTPAVMPNMVTGGESLDLDVLAKAAVSKRKEQERQTAEAAARDSVIVELHRRAARQAALSAAAQQHAVNWLQAPMDADDADYIKHHVDIVQSLLAQANLLQPEEQRVVKKTNTQLFVPLNQALGGLVDYPSDDDSHMSRALTESQNLAQPSKGEAEASSGAAGGAGDLEADATGGTRRAGHPADGTRLAGAVLPCSRLSGQQLGEALDSLRELGSVHMNLSLLSGTGVLAFVDHVRQSPEASVAYMADMMSRQWRRSLASHLYTVTQPWPNRNLAQETTQLLEWCAGRWGLPLPPVPEATPAAPTQAYATGNKKKRKREGWDSKRGSKGSAALLRASGTSAGTGSKTSKGKASDKKSVASSEPASSNKEPKGKQVKSSPKAAAPSKQQKNSGKQQKPKPATGKDTKAAATPEESATDADASEAAEEAGPSSKDMATDTPVGRAVSYLKQQQQRLLEGSYTQLKPMALAASKGTLQRLSKLPGWNRQSARKKHYASCDAALQAAVSRHKGDCADVTKKRAKKEVLRLVADLLTAVEDLAT
ncbi:hypothetical protein WJX79_008342 [Trebouxia sp. C0005]